MLCILDNLHYIIRELYNDMHACIGLDLHCKKVVYEMLKCLVFGFNSNTNILS